MMPRASTLLAIKNLVKHFPVGADFIFGDRAKVHAVDGISLSIQHGETLGLVGESGSGKTTVGRCILRLVEPTAGEIHFKGQNISAMKQTRFRAVRRHLQMVFQDSEASLNPRYTVRRTLREPFLRLHIMRGREMERSIDGIIQEVEMKPADLDKFPHQLSGGQQQRISIARALIPRPELIVLDEPLSSLDVSVRVQIADLFLILQEKHDLSYLLISHDLSMVKYLAHRIAVMYLGQVVELCKTKDLFQNPLHPYTRALIESIPIPDPEKGGSKLVLKGEIPSATDPPPGCRFQSRCSKKVDLCQTEGTVELREVEKEHWVACSCVGL
jgi:oligopeptide/dipeptide ABC transporter ATP-binding protein